MDKEKSRKLFERDRFRDFCIPAEVATAASKEYRVTKKNSHGRDDCSF